MEDNVCCDEQSEMTLSDTDSDDRGHKRKRGRKIEILVNEEEKRTWVQEGRARFELEKKAVLEELPQDYKTKWGRIAFARWRRVWRPVVILSPYSVSSNTRMRKDWMKMFANMKSKGTPLLYLCYWIGSDDEAAFTLTPAKDILGYDRGVEKGYHKLPRTIQKKLDANKPLTVPEMEHASAIALLPMEVAKSPTERVPFPVFEEYELLDQLGDRIEIKSRTEIDNGMYVDDYVDDVYLDHHVYSDDDDDDSLSATLETKKKEERKELDRKRTKKADSYGKCANDNKDEALLPDPSKVCDKNPQESANNKDSFGKPESKEPFPDASMNTESSFGAKTCLHEEKDLALLHAHKELATTACDELRGIVMRFNRSQKGNEMQTTYIRAKAKHAYKMKKAVFRLQDGHLLDQLAEAASSMASTWSCSLEPHHDDESESVDLRVQREMLWDACKLLCTVTEEFIKSQDRGGRLATLMLKIAIQAEQVLEAKRLVFALLERG